MSASRAPRGGEPVLWARGTRPCSAHPRRVRLPGTATPAERRCPAVRGKAALTDPRAALWPGLAVLLALVLWPARVSVGRGRLVSRRFLRESGVHTDRLVSVRWSNGVAQRLVLRDAEGDRVELAPKVLVANPPLWHLLDGDARTRAQRGTLCCGETALRQLAARVDKETARTVFRLSGLE
ncbi:hypothetical protein [Streptomyces sp. HUAS TT7]|uniref:hypothetical protein n=1 Tax=Streptomyces sp. HUAS TT7 TaxID=3447507 RepID=UPI003F6579CC